MKVFKRGLSEVAAVDAVEKFLKGTMGQMILDTPDMFIGIRNNYINVYLNGCSLLKYSPLEKEDKQYLIHHKYLDLDLTEKNNPYIALYSKDGDLLADGGKKSFIADVLNKENRSPRLTEYIENTKKSKKPGESEKGEKALLVQYAAKANPKPFLLDLEVAFTRKRTGEEKEKTGGVKDTVADRIDMALLEEIDGKIVLKLVEVKVDYDSRLRSSEHGKQEVLNQMKNYKKFIKDEYKEILTSYKLIAENYLRLGITSQFPGDANKTLTNFVKNADASLADLKTGTVPGNHLALDMEPHLLIIRTCDKNMNGKNGICHLERLQAQFKLKLNDFQPVIQWDTCLSK